MRKIKSLSALFIGAILLFACNSNKTTVKDWTGYYEGTLPCADCPGINYQLTLNADSTYHLVSKYLESPEAPITTLSGKFVLEGNTVTITQPSDKRTYIFQLEEGAVRYLDKEGKPYTEIADKYVLTKKEPLSTVDNSQTSLDWNGKYFGVLPCADCEGIEYELTLNKDKTYSLITHYLAEGSKYDTVKGTISWTNSGQTIILSKDSLKFKIEENQVRYLSLDGKKVEGELADAYILKKEGNAAVENKKWNLITLNDEKISDTSTETFYINFHSNSGRVEVKANCNLISFGYRIIGQNTVKIKHGMSTLMACPNSKDEAMMKMMEKVTSLNVENNQLDLLNADGESIAHFELEK